VVRFSMSPEAVALASLGVAVIGLVWDAVSQRRTMRTVQRHLVSLARRDDAVADQFGALADEHRKLSLRQDRLTSIVTDRGWRDSMLLTRFDWRNPRDRG